MRRPYKVTPRVLARIQALRYFGKSNAEIAKTVGVSRESVRKHTAQMPAEYRAVK